MIRFATETDDLSLLSAQAREVIDPTSVLVYDDGTIQGLVVLVQSSHRLLWAESLLCSRPIVALRLLQALVAVAKSLGYYAIIAWSESPFIRALASRRGALLDGPRITYILRNYASTIQHAQGREG